MKVTYNWLKDFVNIKIPAPEFADKLTMAGLEVTSLEKRENDYVFEIEITSNRPDWLSVIGIAREVAAITNTKLRKLQSCKVSKLQEQNLRLATCDLPPIGINVEDKKDCPLYTAKIIQGVKVGPSPEWLKNRLEVIGCRSINNIVDITNYILFEYGEPLHAFDLDKLHGNITVRRAKSNEKIATIDQVERILNSDILVIADNKKPVAAAGVMGGKDTEVTEKTKNVLLEAAVFNPIIIRRSRQKLGLQSESSYRFERGISYEMAEIASWQAVKLINQIAQGQCIAAYKKGTLVKKQKSIDLNLANVNQVLGVKVIGSLVKRILTSLGFTVTKKNKEVFKVRIPLHRDDVSLEEDLIEEIARIFGYAKIPLTLPKITPQLSDSGTKTLVSITKQVLLSLGLTEVITYSLTDKDSLMLFDQKEDEVIKIMNPLSTEQEVLRTNFYPGLCRCIATNLNQQGKSIAIFEIADIFRDSGTKVQEELALGLALCGEREMLLEQGMVKERFDFLYLKGILEALFERLGVQGIYFKNDFQGVAILVKDIKVGSMIKAQGQALDRFEIKNKDVFLAQISLEKIFSLANLEKKFLSLPKYPALNRDISFIVKEDIPVQDIISAIKDKGGRLLAEVKIIDVYQGKQIPQGYKGLTISCSYRLYERTLTEEEVNPIHSAIQETLINTLSVKLR